MAWIGRWLMGRWLLLLMAVWGLACSAAGRGPQSVETPATVGFQELEGGWWYLRADSGETYTPVGLPEAFKVSFWSTGTGHAPGARRGLLALPAWRAGADRNARRHRHRA